MVGSQYVAAVGISVVVLGN